jgi:hypothetical protein
MAHRAAIKEMIQTLTVEREVDVQLNDNVDVVLGTDDDVTQRWDGSNLAISTSGGVAVTMAGTDVYRVTGGLAAIQIGTTVMPSTTGNNFLSIASTGIKPSGTAANAGHLYADFETDDDELFWLSGTGGTATQLTT